jgi:hypothetical protein
MDPQLDTRFFWTQCSALTEAGAFKPKPIVRQAVQTCIELLVELTGKSAHEFLLPHRVRIFTAIYTKPLRALSVPL